MTTDAPKVEEQPQSVGPKPSSVISKMLSRLRLLLQTIYFFVVLVPLMTVYSILEDTFFKTPKSLDGKVIVVTGSGRGLGQGFAFKFADLGCKVACVDIDETLNEETVRIINEKNPNAAKGYVCNVGSSDEVHALKEALYKDFGCVDILVNNAALIAATDSIAQFDDFYLQSVISVNLTSHFYMIREFLPSMIQRNEGHIVAIGSLSAFTGLAKASIYAATKHGLAGLMESLHLYLEEIPDCQVKTSMICPYFVRTRKGYSKNLELKIPELSITGVVNCVVDGIRLDKRIITIPAHFYYVLHIFKLLPDRVNKMMRDRFYTKIKKVPSSQEQQRLLPTYKLMKESTKNENSKQKDS